ncbi:hypothetical protein KAS41_03845 [Candidatus Parcubacteria bacterium]|nr:hypothetical protein [Candidatus Parcubacteria bacterium]
MPKKQDKSITIFNSMNTNNKKEKILPEIKLKYYCKNENSESPKNPDAVCYFCGKKNIAIGSVLDGYSDNPKFVCENCAIDRYKKDHKFKSKKIASARRRRIFDVNYLFNEMITDKYLKEKSIKSIDGLKDRDMDEIIKVSTEAYNSLFSKIDKIKLEETESQSEIEEKLRKKLKFVKF